MVRLWSSLQTGYGMSDKEAKTRFGLIDLKDGVTINR